MKKLTIAISIIFIFAAIRANSQNAPVATIGTVSTYGLTATVPITATNFTNVGSCSLRITYDQTIVSVSSVTQGPGVGGYLDVNLLNSGQIRLQWFTSPSDTIPGNPVVFNIVFSKIIDGTSTLAFIDNGSSCAWYDNNGVSKNDIPFTTYYHGGSVSFQTQNAPITIAPFKTTCPGAVVHVPITVQNFLNVGDVSLTLNYSASVLTYLSYSNTSGFPGLSVGGAVPGKIVAGGFSSGVTLPDNAVLFTLNFLYIGGSSALTWFDNGGSCEYTSLPDHLAMNDTPAGTYYINGSVDPGSPPALTTTQKDVNCNGNATGSIDLSVSGGVTPYSYSWTGAGVVPAAEDQSGLAAGIYNVTVTDANSCKGTASVTITEPSALTVLISSQTNVTNYLGNDGSATVTASGGTTGYTYLWNNGQAVATATGLTAGTYTVTVTDAHTCTATTTAVITQPDALCLKIKVFLQGPYDAATHMMTDNLRVHNYIPVTEPYSTYPYNLKFTHVGGGGGETVTNPGTVFGVTGTDAIVDWVFIELRDKDDKTLVRYTRSALLQRDGDVVDVDGVSPVCLHGISSNQFYIVVRHRNHLGVMTATAKTLTTPGLVVNFTDGSEPEFNWGTHYPGIGAQYDYAGLSQSTPEAGKRALWFGNTNSDNKVKFESPDDDQSNLLFDVLFDPGNVSFQSGYDFCTGYFPGDVDLNGKSKYESPNDDLSLILVQVLFYPLNTTFQSAFDFMLEQLP